MNGSAGPTWQTYLWASMGCYTLFYMITNVWIERRIGSPTPPGSGLPVFMLGYLIVVLLIGYWCILGYRAEFATHTRGQLFSMLLAGLAAGGGLIFFFLAVNRAGESTGGQVTILAILNLTPVPALIVLFFIDAATQGAQTSHLAMRAIGAVLALVGGGILAVYSMK